MYTIHSGQFAIPQVYAFFVLNVLDLQYYCRSKTIILKVVTTI